MLSKPAFPIFWREELGDLLLAQHDKFPTVAVDVNSGRGFRGKVPGGLTQEAIITFTNLAIIDQIMEQCRTSKLELEHKRMIVNVRNSAQHRLLSLPTWDELDAVGRSSYQRISYECCRLTVLLYSNAVIFPIPPHSGYPSSLLEQITALLTPEVLAEWRQRSSPLLVWLLVVGGIAAYRSAQRPFFEKTLRETLDAKTCLSPRTAVLGAVREFLWTESACADGFNDLWKDLKVKAPEEVGI